MAETEERSLDNFFAKRDKKKKKERSNRAASAAGASGAAGGSSGAAGAAGSGAGARPGDGGTAGSAGPGAATKAVTKVRGRDSGPGPRACAHVPAPARLPGGASGRGLRGPAGGQTGAEAGHVTRAAPVGPAGLPAGPPFPGSRPALRLHPESLGLSQD